MGHRGAFGLSARQRVGSIDLVIEFIIHFDAYYVPSHGYCYTNGRIYGGMTGIVRELNEVVEGQGVSCPDRGSYNRATELSIVIALNTE